MRNHTLDTINKTEETVQYVKNPGGPTLGYNQESGVGLIEQDGLFFKDLSVTASWTNMRTGGCRRRNGRKTWRRK